MPYADADMGQAMVRHLIDEYRLLTYPVALGKGRRLFADGTKPAALRLVDSKTTSTGVTVNVYESAGEPTYGSFELDSDGSTELFEAKNADQ